MDGANFFSRHTAVGDPKIDWIKVSEFYNQGNVFEQFYSFCQLSSLNNNLFPYIATAVPQNNVV